MKDTIYLDAYRFREYGGWKLDSQFAPLIGSSYLLACGMPGEPVGIARTSLPLEKGRWRFWVRTKNWYPSHSPGTFRLLVNGTPTGVTLGNLPTHAWHWQCAGDADVPGGEVTLEAEDLTGWFGRFAAVIVTRDMDFMPERPKDAFLRQRAELLELDETPRDLGCYDLIVAGGGPAGMPLAIAAARHGARVLILHNRPVLGGNGSREANIFYSGAASRQMNAREGGIAEEAMRVYRGEHRCFGDVYTALVDAETNLDYVLSVHVCGCTTENGHIRSVTARDIFTGAYVTASAKLFADCTGDGWLGYYAGAKYRYGREAAWEYDEDFAPAQPDNCTLSGTLMSGVRERGNGRPMFEDVGHPVTFTAPDWAPKFPEGRAFGRNIDRVGLQWWLEAPNNIDDLYDGEQARDELMRINLGYFDYLKNRWHLKERAANYRFSGMNLFNARRESRRFIGDYVLNQNDCVAGRIFDDTVAHLGWPIDLHHVRGIYSGLEGPFFSNTHIRLTGFPYRCLYSKNVPNLFFAGRCASVSHIALGTARVQNTIAASAQAAGTAAALCVRYGCNPRDIGTNHFAELQQILLRDDQYIPGIVNNDPDDLARTSSPTASSVSGSEMYAPYPGFLSDWLELDRERACFMARGIDTEIPALYLWLRNDTDREQTLTLHFRIQADPDGFETPEDTACSSASIKAGQESWVRFPLNVRVELRYFWFYLERCDGVWWRTLECSMLDFSRSERTDPNGRFEYIFAKTHAASLCPLIPERADCSPAMAINGVSRILDAQRYEWVSANVPTSEAPEWLALTFDAPTVLSELRVTFDTDMDSPHVSNKYAVPPQLVRDYRVEVCDGTWRTVAEVRDNLQRLCVHRFDPVTVSAVRVSVTRTQEGPAWICEMRAYSAWTK